LIQLIFCADGETPSVRWRSEIADTDGTDKCVPYGLGAFYIQRRDAVGTVAIGDRRYGRNG